MSEQTIIEQCSPTLAGIKTANLFPCKYSDKQVLWQEIRDFNRTLSHKGVRMIPVRAEKNFALIYLYRPKRLKKDLTRQNAADLLKRFGYTDTDSEKCVAELVRRFAQHSHFPHEVGLFLGYPPEDVKGFIENNACGCKCVGCWKVYGDRQAAQKCFAQYKKCTQIYKALYRKGRSLERLTVAV